MCPMQWSTLQLVIFAQSYLIDLNHYLIFSQILKDAEQTPLKDSSRGLTYDLLCAMAKPSRTDTRGLSQLAEVAERFAFTLVTDTECGAEGKK